MSVYDEIMGVFNNPKFVFDCMVEYKAKIEKGMEWLDCIQNDIEEFERTGILGRSIATMLSQTDQMEIDDSSTKPDLLKQTTDLSSPRNSLKENIQSNHQTSNNRITRQMKNSILSNVQQEHDNIMNNLNNVQVKLEKISSCFNGDQKLAVSNVIVKEEMLPPKKPPVRNTRKKKGTGMSTKVKAELIDEQLKQRDCLDTNRDSDVQIQKQNLDVIVLEDTIIEQEPIRATRSRTKAQKATESAEESQSGPESRNARVVRTKKNNVKAIDNQTSVSEDKDNDQSQLQEPRKTRSRNENTEQKQSEDNEEPQLKRRKVNEEFNQNGHFDAITSTPVAAEVLNQQLNETLVINKPTLLNETVVLEKAKVPKQITTLNDIMTEDEDIVDTSPPRSKRQKKLKPVFSPYENSPVKKRVQAFEKLGAAAEAATKLSRPGVVKQPSFDKELKKNSSSTQKLREIPRLLGTPLMENKLKHLQPSSASKFLTSIPVAYNMSNKTTSGMKTSDSKMEFYERELRRKQKEVEAMQKKEALILAQTEEKRKKREEREMKVQKIKIAMEKDKQKQLEIAEKVKDEKMKQVLAEKEAKFLKQKEEAAKKRAAAAKKVLEAKQNEEVKSKKFIPPYFKYETPLLPTPDCYDSDDSSYKNTVKIPNWQKSYLLCQTQQKMGFLKSHEKIFFLSGPRSPNLQNIFPTIEPAKLKRTSSAIWNKTEMSVLENLTDED